MDGQRMKDGMIPLGRDLVKHRVVVRMGNAQLTGKPHIAGEGHVLT
jgi:hypothetical protein